MIFLNIPSREVFGSHLFQRVASFLQDLLQALIDELETSSHLFQRVASFLQGPQCHWSIFKQQLVLISFREWLHSYIWWNRLTLVWFASGSHLFQRVASFLQLTLILRFCGRLSRFSSLSESGFIPTNPVSFKEYFSNNSSHLFQRVASFLLL